MLDPVPVPRTHPGRRRPGGPAARHPLTQPAARSSERSRSRSPRTAARRTGHWYQCGYRRRDVAGGARVVRGDHGRRLGPPGRAADVRDLHLRDVEVGPPGAAQPLAEVDVLEEHEVAVVEPADGLERLAPQQQARPREPPGGAGASRRPARARGTGGSTGCPARPARTARARRPGSATAARAPTGRRCRRC